MAFHEGNHRITFLWQALGGERGKAPRFVQNEQALRGSGDD